MPNILRFVNSDTFAPSKKEPLFEKLDERPRTHITENYIS